MQNEGEFHFHALPAVSGNTRALIVLLHGHASHPDKYLSRARELQAANPDADVILVRGPQALKHAAAQKLYPDIAPGDTVYTWLNLDEKPAQHAQLILRHAFNRLPYLKRLNRFIDGQLKKRGLQDKDLALVGFSMGGAVAVQLGLRRRRQCAAVVCHSGMVLPFTRAGRKPPTLMLMGDQDDIFFRPSPDRKKKEPRLLRVFNRLGLRFDLRHTKSVRRLKKLGVPVEDRVFANQGHCATDDSWRAVSSFVARHLGPRK